ncbi:Bug family tripartite tricarboxylate transporter substrate binding protein [Rhodoplanes sp. Z2-YC6860]|uniref:Bug family tripartite tricarboxylate transporter substrate binding protein n=1 Tax=Rhodoplanes sp. Z2-YC6860 TaxID=674703 RepID=UPI00078DB4D5|nr:tripartite tricarboxylate transporter substrate binding protein [Rhodoplanes sp. Z2-YC6860]AMN39384.1 extra-cytoplasmic solute receptor family protein [Rhodoplanes sp. Z2-YC6860]
MKRPEQFQHSRRALLGAALAMPFIGTARAQSYPSRNLRVIVPFAAGGPTDVLTRIAAERVSPALGQPLVVESRTGAGGNLAGEFVARSEADGHTLLVAGQAILAINKALYKKLNYDPATDFAFVGMLGVIANVLLVNPAAVPVNSMAELVALAKQKPGAISYGSNGAGSLTHLTTAILAHQAGVQLLHVPYQGAAPLMTDLIAGRIGMAFTATSAALPLVQSGQLRALAVTTGQRSRFAPNVPTLVESGFPTLNAPVWFGAVVRASTPAPVVSRLRAEFDTVIKSEGYSQALEKQFMEVMRVPPESSEQFLSAERALWSDAVKLTGVSLD